MFGSSVSIARVAVLRLSFDASSMRPKTGSVVGVWLASRPISQNCASPTGRASDL